MVSTVILQHFMLTIVSIFIKLSMDLSCDRDYSGYNAMQTQLLGDMASK